MRCEIFHGDYRHVLERQKSDLIITSPPYNIGSESPAKTGVRNAKLGTYDPKSYRGIREYADTRTESAYQEWQLKFLQWSYEHLNSDGVLIYNHKPRRKGGRMIHPMEWILKCESLVLMEEIIWDRGSTHNHCPQLFWPHTERLYIFKRVNEKYPLVNGRHLSQRSDVWRIPRAKKNGHNAPFPLSLVNACLDAFAFDGCRVMDPFLGSGTTALACLWRRIDFVGAEKLAKYYNYAKKRVRIQCCV